MKKIRIKTLVLGFCCGFSVAIILFCFFFKTNSGLYLVKRFADQNQNTSLELLAIDRLLKRSEDLPVFGRIQFIERNIYLREEIGSEIAEKIEFEANQESLVDWKVLQALLKLSSGENEEGVADLQEASDMFGSTPSRYYAPGIVERYIKNVLKNNSVGDMQKGDSETEVTIPHDPSQPLGESRPPPLETSEKFH